MILSLRSVPRFVECVMRAIDMIGKRFGRLTILCDGDKITMASGYTIKTFVVRCDCGTEKTLRGYLIRIGNAKSCGCLRSEVVVAKNTKHGEMPRGSRSAEYEAWIGMKKRCYNENCDDYPEWGGRGIRVCPQWLSDFAAFLAYIGRRPSPAHTLDRYPNNDGHYEPGNLRWATRKEQAANTRPRRKRAA